MLDIYIEPNSYNNLNTSSFELTWKAISLKNNILNIKLNFKNPLLISSGKFYDSLVVNFTDYH